jgi:hypothetical protein
MDADRFAEWIWNVLDIEGPRDVESLAARLDTNSDVVRTGLFHLGDRVEERSGKWAVRDNGAAARLLARSTASLTALAQKTATQAALTAMGG